MAEKRGKRKLTAIMSADVVGYNRLMEDDEETTFSTDDTEHSRQALLRFIS
jgi:class 3 adenylate cyclase